MAGKNVAAWFKKCNGKEHGFYLHCKNEWQTHERMSEIWTVTKYFLTFSADKQTHESRINSNLALQSDSLSLNLSSRVLNVQRMAKGAAGRCVSFTLKDSPGAKGKKERVFSARPHFPARRALRWTALSGKLTCKWRPTSASVSSSCGALDRVTSMLRQHGTGKTTHVLCLKDARLKSEHERFIFIYFKVPGFISHNPLYCDKLDSDIFWSPNSTNVIINFAAHFNELDYF